MPYTFSLSSQLCVCFVWRQYAFQKDGKHAALLAKAFREGKFPRYGVSNFHFRTCTYILGHNYKLQGASIA